MCDVDFLVRIDDVEIKLKSDKERESSAQKCDCIKHRSYKENDGAPENLQGLTKDPPPKVIRSVTARFSYKKKEKKLCLKTLSNFLKGKSLGWIEAFTIWFVSENEHDSLQTSKMFYALHENMKLCNLKRLLLSSTSNVASLVLDFSKYLFPMLERLFVSHCTVLNVDHITPQLKCITLIDAAGNSKTTKYKFGDHLEHLNIRNMAWPDFQIDLGACLSLKTVVLCENELTVCPILPLHGALEYLDLGFNNISAMSRLPNTIKSLDLRKNNIMSIDHFPLGSVDIRIDYNPIRRMPGNLLLCDKLLTLYFYHTQITLSLPEIRFLEERMYFYYYMNALQKEKEKPENAYADSQIVHNTFIQKTFLASCQNLFTDNTKDLAFTGTGNAVVDKIIRENCLLRETHIILKVSFGEVFQKVWNRIASVADSATRLQLLCRLKEEILDGQDVCFTGKITRLVNTLVGFYDDISISVGENEQILAKIMSHIQSFKCLHTDTLTKDLMEIGVAPEKIDEWIEAFKEYTE
jgi:hypothetical protein